MAPSSKLGKQAPYNMLTSRKYETAVVLVLKDCAVSTLIVSQSFFFQSKQALSRTQRQAAVVQDNKEASWRSQGQR